MISFGFEKQLMFKLYIFYILMLISLCCIPRAPEFLLSLICFLQSCLCLSFYVKLTFSPHSVVSRGLVIFGLLWFYFLCLIVLPPVSSPPLRGVWLCVPWVFCPLDSLLWVCFLYLYLLLISSIKAARSELTITANFFTDSRTAHF